MSRKITTSVQPTLTPSCITAGRNEAVVVEFSQDVPQDVLITFDFFYESSSRKLGTVPAVVLGSNAVRANFPEFPKPGEVEVTVKLAREESTRFPKFKVHVQSPVEAIYHNVPMLRPSHRVGLLASILAYLMYNEPEKEKGIIRSHIDVILCNILQAVNVAEIPEWNLSVLIAGLYGPNENLLHFCMRHKLDGMADVLLRSKHMKAKLHLLHSKGHDSKTPAEIAKKNGMKRVCDQIDRLLGSTAEVTNPSSGHVGTPQEIKHHKRRQVGRTRSAATFDLAALRRDVGPLPLFIHKDVGKPKKSKQKLTGRLKAVFTGDKGKDVRIAISSPLDQMELPLQETCPLSPGDYTQESSTDRLSKPFPLPGSDMKTSPGHPSCIEEATDGMATIDKETAATASEGGRSAVSNALYELKKKSLYTAVVTQDYQWSSSPFGDFTLHIGDQVYVTKELEGGMCLGVSNSCYGRFPLDILKTVDCEKPTQEDMHDRDSDGDFNPYDRVDEMGPTGYLIPRIVHYGDSDSGSESDHTYDLPPSENLSEDVPHYKKVPRRTAARLGVRLLSRYIDSSSHDTGLDRLGLTLDAMLEQEDSPHPNNLLRPASINNIQNTGAMENITIPSVVAASTSEPCLLPKKETQQQSDSSFKDAVLTGSETIGENTQGLEGTDSSGDEGVYDDTIVVKQQLQSDHKEKHSAINGEVVSPAQTTLIQPEKESEGTQSAVETTQAKGVPTLEIEDRAALKSSPRVKRRSLPVLPTEASIRILNKTSQLSPRRILPTPPAVVSKGDKAHLKLALQETSPTSSKGPSSQK